MIAEEEICAGAAACIAGIPPADNASEAFMRGFGLAYAAEASELNAAQIIEQYLTNEEVI